MSGAALGLCDRRGVATDTAAAVLCAVSRRPKREVVDLLSVADPRGISLPGRPRDIGLGNPFSMPYVTIEALLPIGGRRLAIVNDTNFGSTGATRCCPTTATSSSSRYRT
jgi:hypothetical protein